MSATGIGVAREEATAWRCDPYTDALASGRGPLFLRRADGSVLPLDVERWCGGIDTVDATVLDRCEGSTLDVGCGPGRLVRALAERGRTALGVDLNPLAVAHANASGGRALCRSAFDPLPDEGGWCTALLIDGNIGIGGAPERLLARVRDLVRPGGLLIAETAPDDVCERMTVRVTDGRGGVGAPFPWARLGLPALLEAAERSGWCADGSWRVRGRLFAALRSGPEVAPPC
ncbi:MULTISPECIES: bifunctional 2-polyprenyl-6-hydroxyphenol methylase/3-demethylubiquinol 3-O-methyltransferase UbiG [unclassified Nocardiopsis]|uniref:class I SAM-dependent methyltransferase n=1 Tax=unclassified Nocardiopsis TaxID=2649073 RepID=UPI001F21DF82|nr:MULTISPECIES: methyltransferase domain-containing protein [unclassified Nocardiopsis]